MGWPVPTATRGDALRSATMFGISTEGIALRPFNHRTEAAAPAVTSYVIACSTCTGGRLNPERGTRKGVRSEVSGTI